MESPFLDPNRDVADLRLAVGPSRMNLIHFADQLPVRATIFNADEAALAHMGFKHTQKSKHGVEIPSGHTKEWYWPARWQLDKRRPCPPEQEGEQDDKLYSADERWDRLLREPGRPPPTFARRTQDVPTQGPLPEEQE